MKRILLFTLVIGLFAVQANAALWELDRTTALGFTTYSNIGGAGDDIGLLSVYDGPGNKVFTEGGVTTFDSMSGMVGFVTNTFGDLAPIDGGDADTTVTAQIDFTGAPGLPPLLRRYILVSLATSRMTMRTGGVSSCST